MRPNAEEALRGFQSSLLTYVLPELQTEYARTEVMIVLALLGIIGGQWDGAAQRLVDDNASLRELSGRGAEALAGDPAHTELGDALGSLAQGNDPSVRLSELSAANAQLRAAIAQLGAAVQGSDSEPLRSLRAEVIDSLRAEAESRSFALMGPRADG
jgi:hypothetical protein